jgi:hypothetical protein
MTRAMTLTAPENLADQAQTIIRVVQEVQADPILQTRPMARAPQVLPAIQSPRIAQNHPAPQGRLAIQARLVGLGFLATRAHLMALRLPATWVAPVPLAALAPLAVQEAPQRPTTFAPPDIRFHRWFCDLLYHSGFKQLDQTQKEEEQEKIKEEIKYLFGVSNVRADPNQPATATTTQCRGMRPTTQL